MKPYYLVSLLLTVFTTLPLTSQELANRHAKIHAGIGVPEFAGIALGLENDPVELRAGGGILPLTDDLMWSVYGDLSYHFGKTPVHTPVGPWYVRTGLLYMEEITSRWKDRYLYLSMRVGRSFNLDPRWSIEVDAGIGKELFYERIKRTPDAVDPWLHFSVVPSFGISAVYRFIP